MSSNKQHVKHKKRYSSSRRKSKSKNINSHVSTMDISNSNSNSHSYRHHMFETNHTNHTKITKHSGEKLFRHGLNINLSARPIKSLSKNTQKAHSKPALNTMDISYNKRYNHHKQRQSYSNSKSKSRSKSKSKRSSSRFTKRISAPIILPTSTTPSSITSSATANLTNVTTPYYSNLNHSINSDLFLDQKEINAMIRSSRRISKSRPRAYSNIRLNFDDHTNTFETLTPHTHTDTTDTDSDSDSEGKHDYHRTLSKYGYVEICVIAKSLQGIVIKARPIKNKNNNISNAVIIKITDRNLHAKKISNKHGKSLSVEEDIIKEKKLLMYLTANNGPRELVKFLGFFSDKYNYYLVMENGGSDFFDWIVKCHKWIRDGKLSLKQWNLYIQDLMLQIIKFIKWLHCKMNVCHLDISLENMLIKNNKYKSDGAGGIRLSRKMQIKICDYGLAEYFNTETNGFLCRKYVGKTHYKAPKVYGKKLAFDARKADIWSLGVSFFMMLIGAPPYKLPTEKDDHFPMVKEGNVMGILKRWGRDHYINKSTEILLNNMLNVDEGERMGICEIERHVYMSMKYNNCGTFVGVGVGGKYKRKSKSKNKHKSKLKLKEKKSSNRRKPSNPIHCNIMATYHDKGALMESGNEMFEGKNNNHNIFQNLVMSQEDGQLFRYRKRKLTST